MDTKFGKRTVDQYWFGCINPHVVAAGWAGGIGRGLVEGPFEMVKVRKQIVSQWKFTDAFNGFGVLHSSVTHSCSVHSLFIWIYYVNNWNIMSWNFHHSSRLEYVPMRRGLPCGHV